MDSVYSKTRRDLGVISPFLPAPDPKPSFAEVAACDSLEFRPTRSDLPRSASVSRQFRRR